MIPLLEIHENRGNVTPEKQDSSSTKMNVAMKKKLNACISKNVKPEKALQVCILGILMSCTASFLYIIFEIIFSKLFTHIS